MKETSRTNQSDAQRNAEIDAYIERFKDCTPEELLRYMGEARDFFWKYMTPPKAGSSSKPPDSATSRSVQMDRDCHSWLTKALADKPPVAPRRSNK